MLFASFFPERSKESVQGAIFNQNGRFCPLFLEKVVGCGMKPHQTLRILNFK
jgi:hypothetical protein